MKASVLALAVVGVFIAAPAFAGQWDAAKAVCAEALAGKAGVDAAAYNATLEKARDGATKRVTVSLISKNGAANLSGECRVRGGEVTSVELDA